MSFASSFGRHRVRNRPSLAESRQTWAPESRQWWPHSGKFLRSGADLGRTRAQEIVRSWSRPGQSWTSVGRVAPIMEATAKTWPKSGQTRPMAHEFGRSRPKSSRDRTKVVPNRQTLVTSGPALSRVGPDLSKRPSLRRFRSRPSGLGFRRAAVLLRIFAARHTSGVPSRSGRARPDRLRIPGPLRREHHSCKPRSLDERQWPTTPTTS